MSEIKTLSGRNIWYQAHIYQPLSFTHQGINGRPPQRWNGQVERELEAALNAVKAWQRRTRKTIYIGEFGVSTTARESDRARWFDVVLDYCARQNFHWTAHCFGKTENPFDIETLGVLPLLKKAWQ